MSPERPELSRETLVVHGSSRSDQRSGALVPPLVLSATFAHGNPEQLAYSRDRNPTWELLEAAVAQLEGASGAVAFASGMAGIAAALDLLPVGAEVVVAQDAYTGTRDLLSHLSSTGRLRARRVDATAPAALGEIGGAAMVWLETMGNPLLSVPDLRAWAAAAHRQGATLVVDNTLATPLLCRPLELGADLVVHSASKHLGGHSDLMLGVVAGQDPGLVGRLRQHRTRQGGCPGQLEAWLALRGMRTLAVRLSRQGQTANFLAQALTGTPRVRQVHYPGLATHPQHRLAEEQLDRGFGSMLALELEVDAEAAERVCTSTRIWTNATSLGSVESLLERRGRWAGEEYLPEGLIRLSCGIENQEDLLEDLGRALAQVGAGPLA